MSLKANMPLIIDVINYCPGRMPCCRHNRPTVEDYWVLLIVKPFSSQLNSAAVPCCLVPGERVLPGPSIGLRSPTVSYITVWPGPDPLNTQYNTHYRHPDSTSPLVLQALQYLYSRIILENRNIISGSLKRSYRL